MYVLFLLVFQDDDVDCPEDPREHYTNYDRVFAVLKFSVPVMNNNHSKVAKMARRVFFMVSRLQAHLRTVFKQINDLLDVQEMNVQVHMKRKLLRVAEEYHLAQQMGAHRDDMDEPIPPFTTPIISASSTPRSSSPVNSAGPHINVTVHNFVTGNLIIPSATPAPPNSPAPKSQQRRQEQEHAADDVHPSSRDDHEADGASVSGSVSSHDPSGPLTPPPTPHHRPSTLPISNLRRTGSSVSHYSSQDPSDSDECSGPHSMYEEDVDIALEAHEEQESFDSHEEMTIPEEAESTVFNTTGPGVRTLERKRKVEVVDACVSTSPRLSLRGLNVVTPSELEVLIQHHEQLETSPSVSHPMTVSCSIHGMSGLGANSLPNNVTGVLESTLPVFEAGLGTQPLEVMETEIVEETATCVGAPSARTCAPPEDSSISSGDSQGSTLKTSTREVGTSPMPTQEVLAMPLVHKVAKLQHTHTRSASLPITLPLIFGEPLAPEVLKPNLPDQLASGSDLSPETPCTPSSDVTSHRLSIIKSEDEGLKSDNEGLKSDEEGLHSDDDGLKSYDEGLKSDDEGLRSDDDMLSSANATLNTTNNYEDFSAITMSPSRSEDSLNKVTFKTEVATTPNRSPTDTGASKYQSSILTLTDTLKYFKVQVFCIFKYMY